MYTPWELYYFDGFFFVAVTSFLFGLVVGFIYNVYSGELRMPDSFHDQNFERKMMVVFESTTKFTPVSFIFFSGLKPQFVPEHFNGTFFSTTRAF